MAKNATTLYINDASIRLLVTKGKRISKLASVPLETGLSDVDSPEKEAALVDKIKTLMHTNKISGKKIILGISGLHCLTRPISLPELPKAMIPEAIAREAQRVLPVPAEQLYISWQIIGEQEGKLTAFLVAIPRQIADTLMRILHAAGLKPFLMDIKPLALARLAKEPTAVIVDVQPKEFDIVLLNNGMPQPIRTVPFPEEYLEIGEKVPIIADELARTIQFQTSNNPEQPLSAETKLYLSGDIADETELHEELVRDLDLTPELLTSPLKCAKHLDPSLHLANVGLVLKQLPKDAGPLLPNFNTLPVPYQPRQISASKLMAVPAAIAAVALLVLLAMTVQNAAGQLANSQAQLATTNLLLQKRQQQKVELTDSITKLQQQISQVQSQNDKFASVLANIGATGEAINTDLSKSTGAVFPGVDIGSIIHSSSQFALTGKAGTEQDVIQYVRDLTATGLFTEITINSISYSGSDNITPYSYNLNIKLPKK